MLQPAAFPVALLAVLLTACSGYQIGGNKPGHLTGVRSIHVDLVRNQTQIPRAAAHATNTIVEAFLQDGTYRIADAEHADARLETTLSLIEYRQVSTTRRDALRTDELEMIVHYEWVLVRTDDPRHILEKGDSIGTTRFFLSPNLQTARQSNLPDALNRAAISMVGALADSF